MSESHVLAHAVAEAARRCLEKAESSADLRVDMERMLSGIKFLLDATAEQDQQQMQHALAELSNLITRDMLFDEVGKLTRKLHSSLVDFRNDITPKLQRLVEHEVVQATDQLQSVIHITDQAAHRVLELVERQSKVLSEDKLAIETMSSGANGTSFSVEAAERLLNSNAALREINTEILMAQEFQDLSGQILKKVISLITEVEQNLVALIRIFGFPEQEVPPKSSENAPAPDTVGCNQSDIDDLLGSLGF